MLDEATNEWLGGLLARHEAVAGTVHVVKGDVLVIAAAVNIPPKVQEITATIPLGKGMAGLAWQHDKPIQTCNLKDDNSGAVKPGAKAVDAKAAVALPIHDPVRHDPRDRRARVDARERAVRGRPRKDQRRRRVVALARARGTCTSTIWVRADRERTLTRMFRRTRSCPANRSRPRPSDRVRVGAVPRDTCTRSCPSAGSSSSSRRADRSPSPC